MPCRIRRSAYAARALIALFVLLLAGESRAVLVAFEGPAAGDPVTTLRGLTFSSNRGLGLVASNRFYAASGDNVFGVDDGGDEVFLPSFDDPVTLMFADAIESRSVRFVSSPGTPVGTYTISTVLGDAVSAAVADRVLGGGGRCAG